MKNIKRKYLCEAILSAIEWAAIIAVSIVLIFGPIFLSVNFNPHYFWIFYAFYGFVFIAASVYSDIVRGECIGETYNNYDTYELISKYKDACIVDERIEVNYKTKVYYNKDTNTITLTQQR